jgi:hypothetical protein
LQLRFPAGPGALIILAGLSACGGSVGVDAVGLATPAIVAEAAAVTVQAPAAPTPSISARILECLHCAP